MSGPAHVVVVGGGVTGLAAAHRLHEIAREGGRPLRVTLLEASSRLGGVISTLRRDGFLIEEGPDSILTDKPAAGKLAERLGIGSRIVATREEHRRSFIVRKGRLHPTPEGFYLLAPTRLLPFVTTPLLSPLGKLRAGLDLVLPARREDGDESVGTFVTRRLGRQTLDRIAQPMIAGVYGADPFHLSLRATMPRFAEMERSHGSVIRAMVAARRRRARTTPSESSTSSGARYGLFVSFDEGLQVLTDALSGSLPDGTARLRCAVSGLARTRTGWRVGMEGDGEEADAVILALPAIRAANLVGDVALARLLASIPLGSAATVSVAFRESACPHPLDGFGFVVPAGESLSITGCTFCHRKYPGRAPDGRILLRAFWGGASASMDEADLLRRTLADLRLLLGVRGEPLIAHVARWPGAMPAYPVGHPDVVTRIERSVAEIPGLEIAGNAYRGIGVPDCVASGEGAAERAVDHIARLRPTDDPRA